MTCRDVQLSALREAKKVGRTIGRYFRAASDTLLALSEMASREGGLPTSSAHPRTHDRQILDNCLLRLGDLLAFGSPLLGHTCIWTVTDRIRCREARALLSAEKPGGPITSPPSTRRLASTRPTSRTEVIALIISSAS